MLSIRTAGSIPNENIERLLMERHFAKKARRASGKHHLKGPRKRSEDDDLQYRGKLEQLLVRLLEGEHGN